MQLLIMLCEEYKPRIVTRLLSKISRSYLATIWGQICALTSVYWNAFTLDTHTYTHIYIHINTYMAAGILDVVHVWFIRLIQSVPKRCIHKVNIPYYNVYTTFWDTLYMVKSKAVPLHAMEDMGGEEV
jgi:hypothetical protein